MKHQAEPAPGVQTEAPSPRSRRHTWLARIGRATRFAAERTGEERLLWDKIRFRQVVQGADGRLLILTDEARGRILALQAA